MSGGMHPSVPSHPDAFATRIIGGYVAALAQSDERPGVAPERLVGLGEVFELVAQAIGASPAAAFVLRRLGGHDPDTVAHSVNVMRIGLALADEARARGVVDADADTLVQFGMGLVLHDVGKLAVDPAVLTKEGPLDADEAAQIAAHPAHGRRLLAGAGLSELALSVVGSHHERWDGGGYPDGIAGDQIGVFVQLASMADVYDAIGAARPYRPAGGARRARAAIVRSAGVAFSAPMAQLFADVFPKAPEVRADERPLAQVIDLAPLRERAGARRR